MERGHSVRVAIPDLRRPSPSCGPSHRLVLRCEQTSLIAVDDDGPGDSGEHTGTPKTAGSPTDRTRPDQAEDSAWPRRPASSSLWRQLGSHDSPPLADFALNFNSRRTATPQPETVITFGLALQLQINHNTRGTQMTRTRRSATSSAAFRCLWKVQPRTPWPECASDQGE